jgi:alcohol dehydrogenase class IV
MTLYEYEMKMRAYNLKRVDREYDMHLQAWLNHAASATKEQGKKVISAYKDFTDFYDYKKRLREVEKPSKSLNKQMRRMAQLAKKANEGR